MFKRMWDWITESWAHTILATAAIFAIGAVGANQGLSIALRALNGDLTAKQIEIDTIGVSFMIALTFFIVARWPRVRDHMANTTTKVEAVASSLGEAKDSIDALHAEVRQMRDETMRVEHRLLSTVRDQLSLLRGGVFICPDTTGRWIFNSGDVEVLGPTFRKEVVQRSGQLYLDIERVTTAILPRLVADSLIRRWKLIFFVSEQEKLGSLAIVRFLFLLRGLQRLATERGQSLDLSRLELYLVRGPRPKQAMFSGVISSHGQNVEVVIQYRTYDDLYDADELDDDADLVVITDEREVRKCRQIIRKHMSRLGKSVSLDDLAAEFGHLVPAEIVAVEQSNQNKGKFEQFASWSMVVTGDHFVIRDEPAFAVGSSAGPPDPARTTSNADEETQV